MSEPSSPVYFADAADPEMNAAMERARASFKYFWRELTWEYRRIVPALELAAIKAAFADDDSGPEDVEHMWLSDVAFDGDALSATLLNEPNHLKSIRGGDRVTLSLDRLEDWMYAMRGRVYGGHTVQAMRARMAPDERRGHDGAWGLEFGDPAAVMLVPDWSARAQPGLLGRMFGAKAIHAATDPDDEHPMSEAMATKLGEQIARDPRAWCESTDEHGLTTLHSLALGGSAACVKILLEHIARRAAIKRRIGSFFLAGNGASRWPSRRQSI